ncbi:MAG TPA: hypothetical protein VKI44_37270 [Acetobacteraceae bacterium]|nr:hypothetical protein [Acetobacteraceae bacterium]
MARIPWSDRTPVAQSGGAEFRLAAQIEIAPHPRRVEPQLAYHLAQPRQHVAGLHGAAIRGAASGGRI